MAGDHKDVSYTIEPLLSETPDVMNFLKLTFYVDEPLNKAIGLCEADDCTELDAYCKKALNEGLSFKAVDKEGNIVGLLVNATTSIKKESGQELITMAEECHNSKFKKILYILAKREEGARLWEKYPDDNAALDINVAATHPGWRKRGIMNALVKATESLAKSRRFRLLRLDTSSEYSALSAIRHGFTCVYRKLYTDIKLDGRPLIVPEPPHLYDCVFIKQTFV